MEVYQNLNGRSLDGDVDGVQVSLFDPPHPLDVHIEDADEVLGLHVFYSRFTGEPMLSYEVETFAGSETLTV